MAPDRVVIGEVAEDEDRSLVVYRVYGPKGQPKAFQFVRADEEWRVNSHGQLRQQNSEKSDSAPGRWTVVRRSIAIALVSVGVIGPLPTTGQEPLRVSDTLACACELRVDLLTTLQDVGGRAGLSKPLVVERTGGGEYLVVPGTRQGALLLFDESGSYQRSIGRPGRGPREFTAILAIRSGVGDSTLVMDAGNRRLAVLDPALAITRTARLPVIGGWFGSMEDGGIVVLSAIPKPGAGSLDRVFVLDSTLSILRSFMPARRREPDTSIASLRRRLAVSSNGLVAVSHWARYTIELWRTDGTHQRTFVREPVWFRPDDADWDAPGVRAPRPVQEGPRLDRDGRLWTVVHVPDDDWEESLGPTRSILGGTSVGVPAGDRNAYYDSVIEVLDLDSGRLIASRRIDAHLSFISDAGFAASYREDRNGHPYVDVWRLEVVER